MSRTALLALLQERIGLDPASLGEAVLEQAFGEAARLLGVGDESRLYARAAVDTAAWRMLLEQVVVPETWFHRAPEQFDDLVRFATGTARDRRPLRVLSLPCSSGEEAWSAAFALLDAGLAIGDFEVLGIDVSPLAVARAEAGLYRGVSLRARAAHPLWTEAEGDAVRVAALPRRAVRFRVGNALDPLLLAGEGPFDAVFCRNLLIYLTADARARVLAQLVGAMATPALVLAGQAEVLTTMAKGFVPLPGGSPLSFLRPGETRDLSPGWVPGTPPRFAGAAQSPSRPVPPPAALSPASPPPHPQAPTPAAMRPVPPPSEHATVRRLADGGELEAARERCEALLAGRPDDVEALFLLGLIESADGRLEAADAAFGRVLFLARDHVEALEHRLALAQREGRGADAGRLRARLRRLRESVR